MDQHPGHVSVCRCRTTGAVPFFPPSGGHLPRPASPHYQQREEWNALTAFWRSESGGVLPLVGARWNGKTTLVEYFVHTLHKPPEDLPRASAVFRWSFYEDDSIEGFFGRLAHYTSAFGRPLMSGRSRPFAIGCGLRP